MRTFKLTIAYDGTDFAGWQVQPGRATVQGWIQSAIECLTGEHVSVVGSGRTDAGVHALAQVASCALPKWTGSAKNLADAINTKLPDAIAITESVDARDGFHAIRDAVSKRYRYQIRMGGRRDVFDHRYRLLVRHPLDIDKIRDAASRFIGTKDFVSFQASGGVRKSTVRTVSCCDVNIDPSTGPKSASDDSLLASIEVQADGFLYNMVRNMVGTLLEVGRGKYPPHWIEEVLAAKNRDSAGPTAAAHGLFLKEVHYLSPDVMATEDPISHPSKASNQPL